MIEQGTARPAAVLDHLSILATDLAQSTAFYSLVLPLLGFEEGGDGTWANGTGLALQIGPADHDAPPYHRYGAGLNHFGFAVSDCDRLDIIRDVVTAAGFTVREQMFPGDTRALFVPDPDGLRIEIAWYPR